MAILSSTLWRSKCGALLILWGAYMNIQQITSSHWSYYLLKYAMKCEPQGTIKLDDVSVRSLGLVNATPFTISIDFSNNNQTCISSWSGHLMFTNPNHIKKCWCKVCWFKLPNLCQKWWLNPRYLDFIPLIYIVHNLLTWPNTHLQNIGNNFVHNNNWRRHVWEKIIIINSYIKVNI